MGLKVALQMDPIGSVNIDGDSTFRIAFEAESGITALFGRRGYSVVHDARRLPQVLTSLYASLTA